jgi:hypothetical protein
MRTILLGMLALLWSANAASGAIVFSENFNAENGGVEQLNYDSFAQFDVVDGTGTVDLIGNGGTFDFLPGNGLYVDLDGTTNDSGLLISSVPISLGPGTYSLSFDLAGSQRGTSETAAISFSFPPGLITDTITLPTDQGFTTFSYSFTVLVPTTGVLSFQGAGGDNVGLLLDDIVIESVVSNGAIPEPSTLTIFSLGGIGLALGSLRRRFMKRQKA